MPPNQPNGPLGMNGAALLGQGVVSIKISSGISIEVGEPNPQLINPRAPAPMQGFVCTLHALKEHLDRIDQLNASIDQLDQVVQSLVHVASYLARRVQALECNTLPLELRVPDEHAAFTSTHISNLEGLCENLRKAMAEQAIKQGLSDNNPS